MLNRISTISYASICALLCIVFYSNAQAKVSGSLEWDYSHFEADEAGLQVEEADQFAHKYSILYEKHGVFLNGRGGDYFLALGGEWISVDTDIKRPSGNVNVDIDSSKILFRGEMLFAPGGLPFRFNLYSRDLVPSSFDEDSIYFSRGSFEEEGLSSPRLNILTPHIIDNLFDGERVESGASLTIGIQNGSYLGRYRNVLSHFPKLFIDYKELYVRDLESLTPEHYKDREMAFVSLNKKHNWIHYRFFDHADELFSNEDYHESTIILGTVNQSLRREWINLTNWIQISTDGSYSEETHPLVQTDQDEKIYLLNFFAKADRKNWSTSMYSSYERREERINLEREFLVPIFASGAIDRNTSFRSRFIGYAEKTTQPFALINQELRAETLYASTKFKFNGSRPVIISPQIQAEMTSSDIDGGGDAVSLGIEFATNARLHPDYDFIAGLDVAYFAGDTISPPPAEDDYSELLARFDISKSITNRFRSGIESSFLYGAGDASTANTEYIEPRTNGIIATLDTPPLVLDKIFQSNVLWFVEHVGIGRARNRVELGFAYSDIDNIDNTQGKALHRLDYSGREIDCTLLSRLIFGDGIETSGGNAPAVSNVNLLDGSKFDGILFTNESTVSYYPNKNWFFSGEIEFDYVDSDINNGDGYRVDFHQKVKYVEFVPGSRRQKLYDIEEYVTFELFDKEAGLVSRLGAFGLFGNYYLTSWSSLGTKVKLQQDFEAGTLEAGYGVYAGLNFSKLDVDFSYELGMRTDDDSGTVLDRDEQRWKLSVRKIF